MNKLANETERLNRTIEDIADKVIIRRPHNPLLVFRETIDRIAPHGSELRTILVGAATLSVPLLVGYGVNQYFNRKRLKEKIPWSQLQNGGNVIARVLANHNIKYVFSVNENISETIIEGCQYNKIDVIEMKNVNNAIMAAQGIFRMTNQIGVLIINSSQDLLALSSVNFNFPLLILGIHNTEESFPEISTFSNYESVRSIFKIAPTVEKSLDLLREECSGTYLVEFPYDLICPEEISSNLLGSYQNSRWYFKKIWNSLNNKFEFPSESTDLSFYNPKLHKLGKAKPYQIRSVLNSILESETPILLLGDQCLTSGDFESEELRRDSLRLSIKLLGIPTYLHGFTKSIYDHSMSNIFHNNLDYALNSSDLIIAVGVPTSCLDFQLLENKKVIIIDSQTRPNNSIFDSKKWSYQCDSTSFLHHLSYLMPRNFNKFNYWNFDLKEKDTISSLIMEKKSQFKGSHLNSCFLFQTLKESFKGHEKPFIVADDGLFEENAKSILSDSISSWVQKDRTNMRNISSIGLAIATKLVHPNQEVWMICDENSINQCVQEFDSIVKNHIQINILVGNQEKESINNIQNHMNLNGSSSSHKVHHNHHHNHLEDHHHIKTAYHKIFSGFGGVGLLLSHSNATAEEISNTLYKAKEKVGNQKPILLNCIVDQPISSIIGNGNVGSSSM